jgi:hypothetical protein
MESEKDFFPREHTQHTIQKFLAKLDALHTANEFEQERNRHIKSVLSSMLNTPEQWSANCTINIEWIGDQFVSLLSNEKDLNDKDFLDDIYSMCFSFTRRICVQSLAQAIYT